VQLAKSGALLVIRASATGNRKRGPTRGDTKNDERDAVVIAIIRIDKWLISGGSVGSSG
jgi:hypothetical protein